MKVLVFIIMLVLGSSLAFSQKIAYIDSDYILNQLPNYKLALDNIKAQSTNWQKEIKQKQDTYNQDLQTFENEKILLTDKQIESKEEEFAERKKEINELTEKRFGATGSLLRLRKGLVKPIQDQIANAVKKIVEKERLGFVFDKGSDLIMVYTNPKFDISDKVLQQITGNKKDKKTKDKPKRRKRR